MCVCVRTCSGVPPVAFERCLSFFPSLCSVAQLCLTLFNPRDCSTPGLPVHHQLLSLFKLMSIESVMPSSRLILRRPLLLLSSIFPGIRVFSNESVSDSPTARATYQEASTSLLSLFIRGQTEWKPQSQKTNQSDHMDHSLV